MMADKVSKADSSLPRTRRLGLPSWLLSVCLHGCILGMLIFSLPALPRGNGFERGHEVGLVLRQDALSGEAHYLSEEPSAEAVDSPSSEIAAVQASGEPRGAAQDSSQALALLDEKPPADPSDALPGAPQKAVDLGGLGESADKLLPQLNSGSTGLGREISPSMGKASTKVFGLSGEGYKFVYVFDRSASMGGSGRGTLSAAKAELIKSLDSLGDQHQFQIIFYNEEPSVMNIAGTNRLVFGTDQNKQLARRFIRGITADGATRHEEALMLALRMKPDVIFFLTDADEPALSSEQLQRIHKICDGVTTINTIEFGLGPAVAGENFLARLARENSGRYAYFDISGIGRGK